MADRAASVASLMPQIFNGFEDESENRFRKFMAITLFEKSFERLPGFPCVGQNPWR